MRQRAESLTLNSKVLQKGSESTGQSANAEAGQIDSLTYLTTLIAHLTAV